MAKSTKSKPAAATTETKPTAADAPPATPAAAETAPDQVQAQAQDAPAAAPAATDAPPEQATAPAELADPAAPPAGDESAPPASAEPLPEQIDPVQLQEKIDAEKNDAAGGLSDEQRASLAAQAAADAKQAELEKQAEEKQPEAPMLDRVLQHLAATLDEPVPDYASPSPDPRLHGEAIELNARLFKSMVACGAASGTSGRQGDTLQFLLEQLGESFRRAF
jgi:hypothetical protein